VKYVAVLARESTAVVASAAIATEGLSDARGIATAMVKEANTTATNAALRYVDFDTIFTSRFLSICAFRFNPTPNNDSGAREIIVAPLEVEFGATGQILMYRILFDVLY
jgi:hypothetical protein